MERLSTGALEVIGSEVRRRRQAAQLSMERLAGLASLSRNYVNKIELGQADFSISALVSIAKALDCDLADLFPSKGRKMSPELHVAARLLSDADPEVRKAMIAMLQQVRRSTGNAGG